MNKTTLEIQNKVKRYREKTLDKVMELCVAEEPETRKNEAMSVYLTGLNVAIENSMMERNIDDITRLNLIVQRIAIMETFGEILNERIVAKDLANTELTVN